MISPTTEAFGESLPSTAHSSSRASTPSSTSTRSSYRTAFSTAAGYSSTRLTFVTPTDEPPLAGLTKNGGANGTQAPFSGGVESAVERGVGIFASRRSALKTDLSMPTADAATPAPTYG